MPRLTDDAPTIRPLTYSHFCDDGSLNVRIPATPKRPTDSRRGIKLSETEVRRAYDGHYPAILTLDMAAEISGYARSTLKRLLSEGKFANCTKRKKPVLFWRDRFIQELMQG